MSAAAEFMVDYAWRFVDACRTLQAQGRVAAASELAVLYTEAADHALHEADEDVRRVASCAAAQAHSLWLILLPRHDTEARAAEAREAMIELIRAAAASAEQFLNPAA